MFPATLLYPSSDLRLTALLGVIAVLLVAYAVEPYRTGKKLILPTCLTCHNEMGPLPTAVFRNGSTVCVDHFKMDGARLVQQGVALDKSPGRAPSRYIYKARVEDLVSSKFTKYEVFCARMGRILQRRHPRLTTLRHTIVDHSDTRFFVFGNNSTAYVDAPIGRRIAIKRLPRKRLFGYGGLELVRYVYGPRDDTVMMVKDWRFLHDKLNLSVDRPAVDMNGNEARSRMVTVLRTNDAYYAVAPTDFTVERAT